MEKETFYEMLDIETGDDFQYFENIAELFESDEDIDQDLIAELLRDLDLGTFSELTDSYFNELEKSIPDTETDFFTLVENIKRVMSGMAVSARDTDDDMDRDELETQLAFEIGKFRDWYSLTDNVECVNQSDGRETMMPVRDALVLGREEALGGDSWDLDFNDALSYELSDFVLSFADTTDLS